MNTNQTPPPQVINPPSSIFNIIQNVPFLPKLMAGFILFLHLISFLIDFIFPPVFNQDLKKYEYFSSQYLSLIPL